MSIKIGINGFGRIGRMTLRSIIENNRKDIEVIAINNKSNAEVSSFLLTHDSIHGSLKKKISHLQLLEKTLNMIELKTCFRLSDIIKTPYIMLAHLLKKKKTLSDP